MRKFGKKNKILLLAFKFVAAWYLLIGMSATLTGQTNAYFSDRDTVTGTIQAGTWETEEPGCSKGEKHGEWDCSSLKFVGQKYDGQKIYATIQNTGSDMKTNGTYEIYYIEKGNPKKGKPVGEVLTFAPIKEGKIIEVSFIPQQSGSYMFKAYQHKDHPGNGELWSEAITVSIDAGETDNVEEEKTEQKADVTEETAKEQVSNKTEETGKEAAEPTKDKPQEKPEQKPAEEPKEEQKVEQPKVEEKPQEKPKEESKPEDTKAKSSEAPVNSKESTNEAGE
ncbi:amyloid fiber anchoring/assembly protein TapA [Cytobacillus oceanisediminis]|uniref:amyloid fiber anchoring/assembly protein TapA n=1 Tax=Cytobacillus oceanisediminis TaxID=665099 RepID=UPI00220EE27A|nr:amyloid fiber anchoring/assembly protein TapA [Cytobacillus oceanisediminis]USK47034.1 amyloid fiber anchoring/assembly protein TapA [Cytobacillus oceanisediminis]